MTIRQIIERNELEAVFAQHRAQQIYGLGDLADLYWEPSRWYRRGDAIVGIVPLPESDVVAIHGISVLDPAGTLELMTDLVDEFPVGALVVGPIGTAARFGETHRIIDLEPHNKMVLAERGQWPDTSQVEALDRRHTGELRVLYDSDPGAAFFIEPTLDHDTTVGLRLHGTLVATACTHVISDHYRVAAIGGVLVHPDHRGHGYGEAVTAGVIERIGDRADTIGLNVVSSNRAARRIYERMGFVDCLEYEEIELFERLPND